MSEKTFSFPQMVVISAFVSMIAGLAGWTLNIEIRKADRSEIIGRQYQEVIASKLSSIEHELRYVRARLDTHMTGDRK